MTFTREDILTPGANAGQKRLWRFADAIERDADPDPADVRFLAGAFVEILCGVDPARALGIAGKRHQGRRTLTLSDVAHEIHVAIAVQQRINAGDLLKVAAPAVAAELGMTPAKVKALYKRDRQWVAPSVATEQRKKK